MMYSGIESLDKNTIERLLGDNTPVELAILERTASTNDYLLYKTDTDVAGFYVCLAESQTAGKGRRGGKVWDSPNNGKL